MKNEISLLSNKFNFIRLLYNFFFAIITRKNFSHRKYQRIYRLIDETKHLAHPRSSD